MRPVFRGAVPTLANGQNKTVSNYADWRYDLITRIGKYCSYCNMRLNDSPQVEHVAPKSKGATSRLLDWDNMLLACGPCNRAKSDTDCPATTHLLPDYHNTHLAFDWRVVPHPKRPGELACIIVPKSLSAAQLAKARATILLCKLDAITNSARASDLRWQTRLEALVAASEARDAWDKAPAMMHPTLSNLVKLAAIGYGFFSIWFDVFHDVPVVKEALVQAFPNTEGSCFPPTTFDPVVRVVGDL